MALGTSGPLTVVHNKLDENLKLFHKDSKTPLGEAANYVIGKGYIDAISFINRKNRSKSIELSTKFRNATGLDVFREITEAFANIGTLENPNGEFGSRIAWLHTLFTDNADVREKMFSAADFKLLERQRKLATAKEMDVDFKLKPLNIPSGCNYEKTLELYNSVRHSNARIILSPVRSGVRLLESSGGASLGNRIESKDGETKVETAPVVTVADKLVSPPLPKVPPPPSILTPTVTIVAPSSMVSAVATVEIKSEEQPLTQSDAVPAKANSKQAPAKLAADSPVTVGETKKTDSEFKLVRIGKKDAYLADQKKFNKFVAEVLPVTSKLVQELLKHEDEKVMPLIVLAFLKNAFAAERQKLAIVGAQFINLPNLTPAVREILVNIGSQEEKEIPAADGKQQLAIACAAVSQIYDPEGAKGEGDRFLPATSNSDQVYFQDRYDELVTQTSPSLRS